ncbi:hypothetical protein [Streptomyces liangshanensis]|uniref:Uncharacterized protein n=1 Tax=Streptomyces liangshanensis TaxID=2717324 RepID=A0A6G9H7Q3_9ACTN|nr:hypothetical protein [Streptomyces liangshanensis]QIQ06572.1 hypothetical protein HA039_33500 [Streptomyces liangshanensis]
MSELPPCPPPGLSELLNTLTDAAIDVLDAGASEGWSPTSVSDALDVVDVLVAAAAQRGGPLAAALEPVPALTAAARRAVRDPLPPAPRPRSYGARLQEADGTARFRAWRDARWHRVLSEPCAVTVQRTVAVRAEATAFVARRYGREATALALQAQRDLIALLPEDAQGLHYPELTGPPAYPRR